MQERVGGAAVHGEQVVSQVGVDGGEIAPAPLREDVVAVAGEQAGSPQPRAAGVLVVDGDRVAERRVSAGSAASSSWAIHAIVAPRRPVSAARCRDAAALGARRGAGTDPSCGARDDAEVGRGPAAGAGLRTGRAA